MPITTVASVSVWAYKSETSKKYEQTCIAILVNSINSDNTVPFTPAPITGTPRVKDTQFKIYAVLKRNKKYNNIFETRAEFFLMGMTALITKTAEEYCWAITQVAGLDTHTHGWPHVAYTQIGIQLAQNSTVAWRFRTVTTASGQAQSVVRLWHKTSVSCWLNIGPKNFRAEVVKENYGHIKISVQCLRLVQYISQLSLMDLKVSDNKTANIRIT